MMRFSVMRGPKLKEKLPRPVGEEDAARLLEETSKTDQPAWV